MRNRFTPREAAGSYFEALVSGLGKQGLIHFSNCYLLGQKLGYAGCAFRCVEELQLVESRGLSPVVFHPLVEYVRAYIQLDKLEGTGANRMPYVAILSNGIPVVLANDTGDVPLSEPTFS